MHVTSVSKRLRQEDAESTRTTEPDPAQTRKSTRDFSWMKHKKISVGKGCGKCFYLNYYSTYASYTRITGLAVFLLLFLEINDT